jgi:hypothetical protein
MDAPAREERAMAVDELSEVDMLRPNKAPHRASQDEKATA